MGAEPASDSRLWLFSKLGPAEAGWYSPAYSLAIGAENGKKRMNAFNIVRDFEDAVASYTGAPFCVAVNSCTNALLLACKYLQVETVSIPKRTYVGVAQSILNAGGKVEFDNREWCGSYSLNPYPIRDSARRFSVGMYDGGFDCVSFHIAKILGLDQGGAILHDDEKADEWFRRARFDGRAEGIAPKDDKFIRGYHCYLSPTVAAHGLWRMMYLPKHNEDLPNDDYPDLSLTDWSALERS